jgi:DNA-binding NarL/FixJ family response regulator
MGHPDGNAERDVEIFARRNDGLTLAAIAFEFGLTKETVRLAVRRMERKAMWRAIERNAQRERLASLCRAVGEMGGQSRATAIKAADTS